MSDADLMWERHEWQSLFADNVPSEWPCFARVVVEKCVNCCTTRVTLTHETEKSIVLTHPQFDGAWKKKPAPKHCSRPRRAGEHERNTS